MNRGSAYMAQVARERRAARHAAVQRGEWSGARPVTTLAEMSPEKRARVIAETLANHVPQQAAPVAPARPAVRIREPLPVTAEERAQEAEERATPEPAPVVAHQESDMTTIESARNLRAELDRLTATQAEKRRAALTLASELRQEAEALEEAAGGVPVEVKRKPTLSDIFPAGPPPKPAAATATRIVYLLPPPKPTPDRRKLTERIIDLLADGEARNAAEIALALDEGGREPVVRAALPKLVTGGRIARLSYGVYGRAP